MKARRLPLEATDRYLEAIGKNLEVDSRNYSREREGRHFLALKNASMVIGIIWFFTCPCLVFGQSSSSLEKPKYYFGYWFGGSTLGHTDYDADIKAAQERAASNFSLGGSGAGTATFEEAGTTGFAYGIEGGYSVGSFWGLGAKSGFLSSKMSSGTLHRTRSPGDSLDETWNGSASLKLLLAGGWVRLGRPNGLNLRSGLFFGPAFGSVELKHTKKEVVSSSSEDFQTVVNMSGVGLATEFNLELGFSLGEWSKLQWAMWYFQLSLQGLRPKMTLDDDVDVDGDGVTDYRAGERGRGFSGRPLNGNLSGAGFTFGFRAVF